MKILILATFLATSAAAAAGLPTANDPRLSEAFHGERVWNGITISNDGRVFTVYTQADRPGPQVQELDKSGSGKPYPNATWNSSGGDISHRFVQINSIRIGPDGALWLVDAGAAAAGKKAVKGGARLFRIDLIGNAISRIYDLSPAVGRKSFVDDVRFHGSNAYLTDAGMPGLIVLDLNTGSVRRLLDKHASTVGARPMYADGKLLKDKSGKRVVIHADQLELSPDAATLYFEPGTGPMWSVPTRLLDDPNVSAKTLAAAVKPFADTPTTGGTAIDAKGNLYNTNENLRCIERITPSGEKTTFLCDPRLVWADAMWIDNQGTLWIPAAQMNRTPGMNGGVNAVEYPVAIYKMKLGIGPAASDHR